MTVTAFAEPAALSTLLGTDVDEARAGALLALASDAIRAATQQRIDYAQDDTIVLDPEATLAAAYLPELPVLDVSAVDQLGNDGEWYTLGPQQFDWSSAGILYRRAGHPLGARWTNRRRSIRVTYTHGWETIPADLALVATLVAARLYENPLGMSSTSIGGFAEQSGVRAPGIDFTDVEASILDRYAIARLG